MPERSSITVYVDAGVSGRCTGLGVYIPAWEANGCKMPRPFMVGSGLRGRDSTTKNELQALLFGFDVAWSILDAILDLPYRSKVTLEFRTDAKVIPDVLNNFAKPRTPTLRGLFGHVEKELEKLRKHFGGVSVSYVSTAKNPADQIAKKACDLWRERWTR